MNQRRARQLRREAFALMPTKVGGELILFPTGPRSVQRIIPRKALYRRMKRNG